MTATAPTRTAAASDPQWPTALSGVLTDPGRHHLVLQPVVDLARGVVAGYEALSRFEQHRPEAWFAAALRLGCGSQLEALVLNRALEVRAGLAPGRFLSVNVTPGLLSTPALQQVLADAGSLTGVVLELTETEPFDDLDALSRTLEPWRAAGAAIALDDAGSGYAGLQQISHLRPQLVKVDRSLVAGIDRDPVKQALVETLGVLTGRLDSLLLAEGIERRAELDVVAALGVPLGQGYLLGQPRPAPAELGLDLSCHLLGYADRRAGEDRVGFLLEPVPAAVGEAEAHLLLKHSGGEVAVVLTGDGLPAGLLLGGEQARRAPVSLSVLAGESVADVTARAMTRAGPVRFDPVLCVDERGMLLGVLRVERLALALADRRSRPGREDGVVKQFACGAVVPGCRTVFTAADEAGILAQVTAHAQDAHGIAAPPPELVEQVRAAIVDV